MIHDIAPQTFSPEYHESSPTAQDILLYFDKDKLLLSPNSGERLSAPQLKDLPGEAARLMQEPGASRYAFSLDARRYFLIDQSKGEVLLASLEQNGTWVSAFEFLETVPPVSAFAYLTAYHLNQWYLSNRFCGSCGAPTEHDTAERMLRCTACESMIFPHIAPVVITAVIDGNRLLLTRYANRPYQRYALVAGFVEIGETLEDAVHREVFEETGVRVKNIHYYKSQPWGLSSSLISGFVCELDGSPTIVLDEKELAEAVWLEREAIPAFENTLSITAEMIEAFRAGNLA